MFSTLHGSVKPFVRTSGIFCTMHEERPWGSFTVLDEGSTYKVKRIEVLPEKRLSYQKHSQRAEHWMVVEGVANVTLDGRDYTLSPGETIDIPVGSAHRIGNSAPGKLV